MSRGARALAALLVAAALVPCAVGAGPTEAAFSEPVLGSLRTALEAYEEVRGELAADRLEGVPAGAARLADALRRALDDGPAQLRGVVEEAALGAESMVKAVDLAAARLVFGEVSRSLLLLAGSDPRLAEGWHVFNCPMAESFGKWLQPTETLENPYMGPSMLRCGGPSDWSVPAAVEASPAALEAREASASQPVFKPGIPGLRMTDVRDHKFLWREIEELQLWEQGDRISVAEYRSKVIEKTAHFLELRGAKADEFTAAAAAAVAGIRESFHNRQPAETGVVGAQLSSDLNAGVSRVAALLGEAPRHQLFAPDCKKWLLKLAFGPREAKEAREAREAQAGGRR